VSTASATWAQAQAAGYRIETPTEGASAFYWSWTADGCGIEVGEDCLTEEEAIASAIADYEQNAQAVDLLRWLNGAPAC